MFTSYKECSLSTNKTESNDIRPNIDFSLIAEYEGDNAKQGFIIAENGHYGGTGVALNCDLGEISDADLLKMSLNPTLKGKLYPYLGRTGQDAADYLIQHPLELSEAETDAINLGLKSESIEHLISQFNSKSAMHFCELSRPWQTVLLALELHCKNVAMERSEFYTAVANGEWQEALSLLRQFAPKEANYIDASS